MSLVDFDKLLRAYQARWENLDDVYNVAFTGDDGYAQLLGTALKRGSPLTSDEVTAAMGPDWESAD